MKKKNIFKTDEEVIIAFLKKGIADIKEARSLVRKKYPKLWNKNL